MLYACFDCSLVLMELTTYNIRLLLTINKLYALYCELHVHCTYMYIITCMWYSLCPSIIHVLLTQYTSAMNILLVHIIIAYVVCALVLFS